MTENECERIEILDILKGIATVMVIITHCAWTDLQRKQYLFPFWIDMAVPIFMVITGFLYTKSFYRRKKLWDGQWMKKVCVKYTVPFFIIFFGECLFYIIFQYIGIMDTQYFNFKNAFVMLIKYGGYGPGSYYYICLLQILLFFPIIYWLIDRMNVKGLILCFIINLLYESMITMVNMSPDIYRMIALRYIFALATGSYIFYINKEGHQLSTIFILSNVIIGFSFLFYANQYIGNWYPKILNQWTNTSLIAIMYVFPFVGGVIGRKKKYGNFPLQKIGQISYDIFLVQMAYYNFGTDAILHSLFHNIYIVCILNIVVCIIVGALFSRVERMIVKVILRTKKDTQKLVVF